MLELWKRSLEERKRDQEEARINLEQTLKELKDAKEQIQGFEIKLAERGKIVHSCENYEFTSRISTICNVSAT